MKTRKDTSIKFKGGESRQSNWKYFTKFRFCGDGDCPDWVLAEIISTLSTLKAEKLETLTDLVAKKIIGEKVEEESIKSLTATTSDEGKSAVACLHYLLINAARHNVNENVFNEEIQQLGLPNEHAMVVCRVMTIHAKSIRQKLIDKSFKINELSYLQYIPNPDGSQTDTNGFSKFELKISQEIINGLPENTLHTIYMDRPLIKSLIRDLKHLQNISEKYKN